MKSTNFAGWPVRLRNCRGVLVDSNVLLDIATKDVKWGAWSEDALAECAEHANLIINPIVYAEASIGFTTIEALNVALPPDLYQREPLPWEAGFLAGKCFLAYRRRGGQKTSPMPEFYIGAHAAIEGFSLLTRDAARFHTYFRTLDLLSPRSRQSRPAPRRTRILRCGRRRRTARSRTASSPTQRRLGQRSDCASSWCLDCDPSSLKAE